jgi:hypothetical protein
MNKELLITLVALFSAAAVLYNSVETKDDF